jgi:hypothetical protein
MGLRDRWSGWRLQHSAHEKPWKLFKRAIKDYRANWKSITAVVTIVALPVAILSTYTVDPASDTALSAYLAFAQVAMNTALIFMVVQRMNGKKSSIRQAYYAGSAMLVRLLLVSLLIVVMLIPLLIGVLILAIGVLDPNAPLTVGEQLLLVLLAVIIATPSIALTTRGLWAIFVIYETELGPIQAVSESRRLTKGKLIVSLGRLVALGLLLLATVLVPALVLVVLNSLTGSGIFVVLLQLTITLTVLPLGYLYLYRYYRGLVK